MRRPARTVLWGGRPNLDIQVGSAADRIRQRRLRHQAGYRRLARTLKRELDKLGIVGERAARTIRNALRGAQIENGDITDLAPRITALKFTDMPGERLFPTAPADSPLRAGGRPPTPDESVDAFWKFMADSAQDSAPYTWPSDSDRVTFRTEFRLGSDIAGYEWPTQFPPTSPGGCRHPASALASMDFGHCPGWTRCADCQAVLPPDQTRFIRAGRRGVRKPIKLVTGLNA